MIKNLIWTLWYLLLCQRLKEGVKNFPWKYRKTSFVNSPLTRKSFPQTIFFNNIKSLLPFSFPPPPPLRVLMLSQLLLYTVCQKIIHSQVLFCNQQKKEGENGKKESNITWAWFLNILIYSRLKPKLIFDENYCHFVSINIIRVEVLSERVKKAGKSVLYF